MAHALREGIAPSGEPFCSTVSLVVFGCACCPCGPFVLQFATGENIPKSFPWSCRHYLASGEFFGLRGVNLRAKAAVVEAQKNLDRLAESRFSSGRTTENLSSANRFDVVDRATLCIGCKRNVDMGHLPDHTRNRQEPLGFGSNAPR